MGFKVRHGRSKVKVTCQSISTNLLTRNVFKKKKLEKKNMKKMTLKKKEYDYVILGCEL